MQLIWHNKQALGLIVIDLSSYVNPFKSGAYTSSDTYVNPFAAGG